MKDCSYQSAYKRLSFHYLFYFAVLGAILPYLGLYLQYLSFSAIEIGQLLSIMLFTKVIAPNIWGWLADHNGRPIYWVRIATAITALVSIGLIIFSSYWWLFFTLLIFSFFWHASLPQFESYTFKCLKSDKHRYGEIRLWGSIGFILAVLLIGVQVDYYGIQYLPMDLFVLLVVVWLSSYLVKDGRVEHEESIDETFFNLLKRPAIASLLIVSFLMQFSHGVYYAFYTIQLSDLGYDKTTISFLWALGVIAEIAVFLWMSKLFRQYAVRFLVLLSIALTVLRWWLIGYFDESFWILLFAQFLHAASFGLFHAAAIYLVDQYFSGRNHGKGQALYAATGHGLGVAVGMLIAGYAWTLGGAELAYSLSAIAVIIGYMVAWKWIR